MKTRHILSILVLLVMVFATMSTAGPASADIHTHFAFPVDETFIVDWAPCDFDITSHNYGTMRGNFWVDEQGRPTKSVDVYGGIKIDLTANGKTVNIQVQGPIVGNGEFYEDKAVYTFRIVGATYIATIPHHGIVLGGGGQQIEVYTLTPDLSEVIDFETWIVGGNITWDWGPICEYLGPED